MTLFFRHVGALVWKDFLLHLRDREQLITLFLFGTVSLVLFGFSLSTEPETMRQIAAGLFWMVIFFASVMLLRHSFAVETTDGQWESLLMTRIDPMTLFIGKCVATISLLFVVQLFLLVLLVVLFDVSLSPNILVVLFLGTLGVSALGTLYAGVTAHLQGGQGLLSLLLFPMLGPLLIAATQATKFLMAGDPFGQATVWILLLILFDTLFFLGSLWLAHLLFRHSL